MLDAANNPNDEHAGTRCIPFAREIYIESDDFLSEPPKKFFRLAPGREVRLKYAYFITCNQVLKNDKGDITELRCTYDPKTKGGDSPDGRKVKGTLHWVSASHAVDAEVRLYDYLFKASEPSVANNLTEDLNPNSLQVLHNCKLEPCLKESNTTPAVQFERVGYFCVDKDSGTDHLIYNRTLSLRDSWSKAQGSKNSR